MAVIHEKARETPVVHTCDLCVIGGSCTGVFIVEDKSGRRAIGARYFIDATGDGDVIARLGLPCTMQDDLQPPTTCALVYGLDAVAAANPGFELSRAVHDPQHPTALKQGFLWHSEVVGLPGARMVAGTRVHLDVADVDTSQLRSTLAQGGSRIL